MVSFFPYCEIFVLISQISRCITNQNKKTAILQIGLHLYLCMSCCFVSQISRTVQPRIGISLLLFIYFFPPKLYLTRSEVSLRLNISFSRETGPRQAAEQLHVLQT